MTDKITDDQFKSEVIRFIEIANHKFDGITSDIRTQSFRIDKLEARFDQTDEKINTLVNVILDLSGSIKTVSSQVGSVVSKVIENEERLERLEDRVEILEGEAH